MRDLPEYDGPMVEWPRVRRVPGVAETLDAVSDCFLCCVASNAGDSDADLMAGALARVGLRRHFDRFWTSHELGASKPNHVFYEQILQRLGLPAEACVMVGNSLEQDILPATDAGMVTVWLAPPAPAEPRGADYVIHRFTDLLPVLEQLGSRSRRDS